MCLKSLGLIGFVMAVLCANAAPFKIMSFNIRHGKTLKNKVDLSAAASLIKREAPRFAALQEVDLNTRRMAGVDVRGVFEKTTGMHFTFAKAIKLQGGQYGVALLSKEKPASVRTVPLGGTEPRVLLMCEFADCWVGTFHFAHIFNDSQSRVDSIAAVRKIVEECSRKKPVFMTGDWNARPESDTMASFRKFMSVLNNSGESTFHGATGKESRCIDYVAVDKAHRPKYVLRGRRVVEERKISDHAPVIVEVEAVSPSGKKEGQFTIASFNIRCPTDQGENSFEARRPRIVDVIRKYGFDVFGVQEAVSFQARAIDEAFPDFRRVGCGRNKDLGGEGVYIYFNKNRFECLESGTFWLSGSPSEPGSIYKGASCPRTCTWALLRDRVTDRRFRYFNTHLDHVSAKARIDGVRVIEANGLGLARKNSETIFLSGDLNQTLVPAAQDSLETVKRLKGQALAEAAKSNPIALLSTWLVDTYGVSRRRHEGPHATFHGYNPRNRFRIDYLFATPNVKVLRHFTANERPGGKYPSDHDAVGAVVEI